MKHLLADGQVLNWILAGMVLEACALVALYRLKGTGVRPRALLPNLCSGMCLLLAMRLALGGAWWGVVSLALLGALCLHLWDLRRQWARKQAVLFREKGPKSFCSPPASASAPAPQKPKPAERK